MKKVFSTGKYALAICDRCGCDRKYSELKTQFCKQQKTSLRVCTKCLDKENPQSYLAEAIRTQLPDAEALKDPRPDVKPDPIEKKNWIDRLTLGAAVSDPVESTYRNVYGGNL